MTSARAKTKRKRRPGAGRPPAGANKGVRVLAVLEPWVAVELDAWRAKQQGKPTAQVFSRSAAVAFMVTNYLRDRIHG